MDAVSVFQEMAATALHWWNFNEKKILQLYAVSSEFVANAVTSNRIGFINWLGSFLFPMQGDPIAFWIPKFSNKSPIACARLGI